MNTSLYVVSFPSLACTTFSGDVARIIRVFLRVLEEGFEYPHDRALVDSQGVVGIHVGANEIQDGYRVILLEVLKNHLDTEFLPVFGDIA